MHSVGWIFVLLFTSICSAEPWNWAENPRFCSDFDDRTIRDCLLEFGGGTTEESALDFATLNLLSWDTDFKRSHCPDILNFATCLRPSSFCLWEDSAPEGFDDLRKLLHYLLIKCGDYSESLGEEIRMRSVIACSKEVSEKCKDGLTTEGGRCRDYYLDIKNHAIEACAYLTWAEKFVVCESHVYFQQLPCAEPSYCAILYHP